MAIKKHKNNKKKNSTETEPVKLIKSVTPISELPTDKKEQITNELNMLTGHISEYLKTYMVIGYNMEGIPIQLIIAKNQQEIDSLNHALQRFLLSQSRPPESKNEPPSTN